MKRGKSFLAPAKITSIKALHEKVVKSEYQQKLSFCDDSLKTLHNTLTQQSTW